MSICLAVIYWAATIGKVPVCKRHINEMTLFFSLMEQSENVHFKLPFPKQKKGHKHFLYNLCQGEELPLL